MLKTLIPLFLILSTQLLWAQAASNFDGVDDKATVYHHHDFDLSTDDFTIEAVLRNVALDQSMLTIISKRNLSSNGFALILNTEDGFKLIAKIGKDKYEVDASIFEDRRCHSVGLRRSESEITLFIDDNAYNLGSNNRDINTDENLIIGDDGSNTHNPFNGYIEEVRFWKVARTDEQVFDWNHKCIPSSTRGLIALWNIEETTGQFFHDVASIKHHAYLGSGFSSDNQDPQWISNECLENCCDGRAHFTVSDFNPIAAQWVNFTNTSINAAAYEWSVDNQVVSTNQHLQYSFGMGVYIVRLKVTSEGGCASYYSEAIEVTDNNFAYCGEENNVSPEVQAIKDWENANPSPYPQIKMYDRFGNRYLPNEITIPAQLRSTGSTATSCSCGIFELHFEDMIHNRDYGFDDPVLGADRRAVACRVFEDLSVLVNPSGTLTSNLVQIQVKKSEGKATQEPTAVDELAPGVLAVAGPYLIATYSNGIIDGLAYKTITSGTNAIANTPGWNPNSYHGSIRVDFELPNFFLNNNNWTSIAPSNQTDLYSTLLHESLHILGFFSLIDAENNTNLSKINGTQLYNRFDTYLENSAGIPYIDPLTGILNPASVFNGNSNCTADVKFEGTSNTNQDVYLPAPWNSSILSHFNCTATNNKGCAVNNGYIMNACIASGEMQRSPNQAEYSTLCDIGYQLSTTYGNAAVGSPANNVPYQTYTSCSPACAVAGIDDNLTSTISVTAGSTVTINTVDFLTNDNNTGGSYNLNTVLTSFGTINNITTTGFDFTPDPVIAGTAIIQYQPTCSNGNNGASALIFVTVTPIVFPCNIPASSCNLLCNGDLEQTIYNNGNGSQNNISNFNSFYLLPTSPVNHYNFGFSSDVYEYNNSGNLISLSNNFFQGQHGIYEAFASCEPGFGTTVGGIPLPVDFANGKRKYIGMGAWREHITLSLNQALTTSSTDNYRLGFWVFNTCNDIDIRMALVENAPCRGIGSSNDPYINIYDPILGYVPNGSWFNYFNICSASPAGLNQGITPSATFDMGAPVNSTDGWEYFTLDFHVSNPNLDEVIFNVQHALGSSSTLPKYILIDEITIEPITPQLTITPTLVGTSCPGNKVIIEYHICADIPVSGVNIEAQLPIGSGLLYTNAFDFTNGQITGLDLGVGGNPLCTLVQVEIEIPTGANTPSTQSIFLDVTGGTACTSTASNLTTDLNITDNTTLAISVVPSVSGNVNLGSNFTADVIVSNTGSNPAQNVVIELINGPYSVGLGYTPTTTTIPNIPAGGQYTISAVPISVSGPCGDAQICAEVLSADGACNLPSGCSALLTILGTGTTSFPIEIEGTTTNEIDFPSDITIANNGDLYITGLFNQNINLVSPTGTNSLAHNAPCMSIFVAKYNSCGLEWTKEIPACALPSLYYSPKIVVSSTNEVYLGFSFENSFTHTVNATPTSYTSTGSVDIGIMKFDVHGNAMWFIQDGGVENDIIADIALFEDNPNNQVVISGIIINNNPFSSSGIIGLTGNSTSIAGATFPYHRAGSADSWGGQAGTTFTASYTESPSTSFSPKWAEFIDIATNPTTSNTSIPTQVHELEIDFNGNIYVLGHTYTDFPFTNKNTLNANGLPNIVNTDSDHFIISYDQFGTERWAGIYGSSQFDIMSSLGYDLENPNCPSAMVVDNTGNGYIAIQMGNATSICPSPLPSINDFGHFGLNLLRIDLSNGNLIWSRPIAESQCVDEDHPRFNSLGDFIIGNHTFHPVITVNTLGDVYVGGQFLLEDLNNSNSSDEFTDIDFYSSNGGQIINYTNMSSFNQTINGNLAKKHLGSFVEKFSSNGNFEWVLTNTSMIPSALYSGEFSIPSQLTTDINGDLYHSFWLSGDIDMNSTTYNGFGQNGDGYIIRIQDQGTGGIYARQANNNNTIQSQNTKSTLSTNSVNNTTSNIATKLYPNPTTGTITLEILSDLDNNKVEQITIYDVTGRKVQTISTEKEQNIFDIDLNSQQSGVYFVELMVNQELITKRVILMK